MPNPDEVATIRVGGPDGHNFSDWESVRIELRWGENYPTFQFTTADIVEVPGQPPPANWQDLQLKPGDVVGIYLGKTLAVSGVITVRQTSYDANNKGVMLQGIGLQWYAARASVIHPTGSFDGKSLLEVATEVAGPTGVQYKPVGSLDSTPFKQLQVQPGEAIGHFVERLARPRGALIGHDENGNILLIGPHENPVVAVLREGWNILRCQATISEQNIWSEYIVNGQTGASDDQHGTDASEQQSDPVVGTARRYSPLLTPSEQPVWSKAELDARAANEAKWHQGTIIEAVITVQGWMIPGTHTPWGPGLNVTVVSPMAMLNMMMTIQAATFTQDNASGTLTTLDCVAPWLMNDIGEWNVGTPGVPAAPGSPEGPSTPAPPSPPLEPFPNVLPGQ
jgi:prophage tail gpP-like protein